jgi:hypothetical protein
MSEYSEYLYKINDKIISFRGFTDEQLREELKQYENPKLMREIKEGMNKFSFGVGNSDDTLEEIIVIDRMERFLEEISIKNYIPSNEEEDKNHHLLRNAVRFYDLEKVKKILSAGMGEISGCYTHGLAKIFEKYSNNNINLQKVIHELKKFAGDSRVIAVERNCFNWDRLRLDIFESWIEEMKEVKEERVDE